MTVISLVPSVLGVTVTLKRVPLTSMLYVDELILLIFIADAGTAKTVNSNEAIRTKESILFLSNIFIVFSFHEI